jgi:outer membrane protein
MKKNIGTIIGILALGYCAFLHFSAESKAGIGIVQQEQLMDEFEGMKAAMLAYSKKVEQWDVELDSMGTVVQRQIQVFEQNAASLTEEQQNQHVRYIQNMQAELQQYKASIEQKAAEQDQALTLGVFNQLNSLVEQYAEEKNYTLIIANTANQNVMYNENTIDITADVVTWINTSYEN